MKTAKLSGHGSAFSSSERLREDGALLWRAVETALDTSLLAQFLWRLRRLPLGRPGITALARLNADEFRASEWLRLPSPMRRHKRMGYQATIPNVFADISPVAHKTFLRAARNPKCLRQILISEMKFCCDLRFTMATLARIIEACVYEDHDPVLVRICNFRGLDARWPAELLPDGDSWIAHAHVPAKKTPKRRENRLPMAERMVREFRSWAGNATGKDTAPHELHQPDSNLAQTDPVDWEACQIVRAIAKNAKATGRPSGMGSLARYLRDVLAVLKLERRGRRAQRLTPTLKEAHRLVRQAREQLDLPSTNSDGSLFRGPSAPRVLKLNLVPFRVLESLVTGACPCIEESAASTAHVMQLVDLYTGRRLSDFALTTLGDLDDEPAAADFALPRTKSKRARNIRLPVHRLLPATARAYFSRWFQEMRRRIAKGDFTERTTLFEVVTGNPPPVVKDCVRDRLIQAFRTAGEERLTRYHQFRYAFASSAPVAIELARQPWLASHPLIAPWIVGSDFFSEAQLTNWAALLGSRTASAFGVLRTILGHTAETELEMDYCVSWPLLVLISALRVERRQGATISLLNTPLGTGHHCMPPVFPTIVEEPPSSMPDAASQALRNSSQEIAPSQVD